MEKLQNVIAMRREITDDNDRCAHHERTASRFLPFCQLPPLCGFPMPLSHPTPPPAGWLRAAAHSKTKGLDVQYVYMSSSATNVQALLNGSIDVMVSAGEDDR